MVSVDETTRILTSFLKPGGSLLVVDIIDDGTGKTPMADYGHVVPHTRGFTGEEMKKLFEGAGLTEIAVTIVVENLRMHDHEVTIFMAKGVRAAA